MNPQRLDRELNVDNVDAYKRLDCVAYGRCLDVAAGSGWSQFTCNDCQDYVPETEEQKQETLLKIAKVVS